MASTYFTLIHKKLHTLELNLEQGHDHEDQQYDDPDVGRYRYKLSQHKFDARILIMLCETQTNLGEADAQRKLESLRCIWVQDDDGESETLLWPQDIQDFDLVTFGLERKIQQSKTLIIEQWSFDNFSLMHYCNSSCTNHKKITSFLGSIMDNLFEFHRFGYKTHPFWIQFEILEHKLEFLRDSWYHVVYLCNIDSKELVDYRDFVVAFSNLVASCIICQLWAKKEANIVAITEMNFPLFDMLHKIKPAHVTSCYFSLRKSSNNFMKEEEEREVLDRLNPQGFVDFFFEHTVLKDDFVILREHLILLFTFLAEEVEEEDVIRSQIYGLLHEDAYLLVPMKQQHLSKSKNNIQLLCDFTNKIKILSAKIIQLKYPDSSNRCKAQKMSCIYFEPVRRELLNYLDSECADLVDLYLDEIRFLRSSFFRCFGTWDDSDEETSLRLHSVVTSLQKIWGHEFDMGLLSGRLYAMRKGVVDIAHWRHLLDLELKEKFHRSKQEINAWLLSLSHFSFQCRPSMSNTIIRNFLDSIIYNVSLLASTRQPSNNIAFKTQSNILKEKLVFLNNLLKLARNCVDSKNVEEYNMLAQVFANNAACLVYLYWTNWANDKIPDEINLMLSNMLLKIKPNTPHVARIYIGTLKAVCLQPYDPLLLEQTVTSFVDYFFEDLITPPWKNDFQILREEVIFLLTFVHHHHHTGNAAEEIIRRQLDVLFNDDVYGLLPFHDIKGDFSMKKVSRLSGCLQNIRAENAMIRQLYCKFPDSFVYSFFPKIIGQGFLDRLLQKVRNLIEMMISDQMYVPSAKYKIVTFEQELVSLTSILDQIWELTDLNDAGLELVSVVYLAEHVISMCFIFYHLIWYYIPYLSDVVDRIKAVKKKLEACNIYNNPACSPHLDGRMSTLLEQDWTSEMVGFEIEEKIITDNIVRGSESLDIVSIVGMGGLGKTTLAKKIYGSSSVKSHFNISAFIYVSQDHDKRKILLDILSDIVGTDVKTSCMTEDDLAHKLKKCLIRQKYFIVLDDIWNINAWDKVMRSFPNDQNGSRVMFTTRSLEVAKRAQINCSPHRLRFLTDDESRKLLQKKVFHNESSPPIQSGVVELVAKKCKGLPLAIVVIAGVLARTSESASAWIEISNRVSSYIFDEGCMDVLELSYKHLPEYLKPCFLYLGAFPEDYSYKVQKLTMLWIAEGFIKESKTKSLNDVAKECLYELVNRSLIIVDKTTIGEIHTFRVHDFILDLCRKKCHDRNFFQQGHGAATSSFSHFSVSPHKPLRDSINADAKLSLANTRSLLYCPLMFDYSRRVFCLRKLRSVQVLCLTRIQLQESDFSHMTSLLDLRHIDVLVSGVQSIPSSISNLRNLETLIVREHSKIEMPETLWRMKSLRHVGVHNYKFEVLSDSYDELNAYPQLDKVVSFSRPHLSSGKDVEWLLQRLPNVVKLSCILDFNSLNCVEERVETCDFFHRKLDSLKLHQRGVNLPYLINFPSSLIKLTLEEFHLSWKEISVIAKLQCLQILKLRRVLFPGPIWETEDGTFQNLKYFELRDSNLKLWNANADSFPCMEQLSFFYTSLKELPACFGEISSLKKITLLSSPKLKSSVLRIQEEHKDLGNNVELDTTTFPAI